MSRDPENIVFGSGMGYGSDSDSLESSDSEDEMNVAGEDHNGTDPDDGEYEPSLAEVIEEVREISGQITQLDNMVTTNPTIQTVHEVKSQIANIFGILEDLQYEMDALAIMDSEGKMQRRQAIADVEGMFTSIADLSDRCLEVIRVKADEARTLGNALFKKQDFLAAIKHYSSAISIEPKNATLYTNRALAYQKLEVYDMAIEDAKTALSLDVNYLKAYVIMIKSQLAAGMIASASETVGDVPNAFHDRVEIQELKQSIAVSAKDSGNVFFKSGDVNEAISMYTVSISCDPDAHVYYSNRSAAYQSRKSWKEALSDAERCLQKCRTFPKAYIHMGRCQLQLKRYDDAERTVALANTIFEDTPELANIAPQLADISKQCRAIKQQTATREATGPSPSVKAAQFKDMGNRLYQREEYQEAIRYYTQALSLVPNDGSYYGNRAAAWLMMREYRRAIKDCVQGLEHEERKGSLDKLRIRHANALAAVGDVKKALVVLGDAISLEGREVHDSLDGLQQLLDKLNQGQQYLEMGKESIANKQFSRGRRLLQNAQSAGLTDDPQLLLGLARASLGLHEYEDASRAAQKVIEADGSIVEAYLVRADALLATGCTDLAEKHLKAALQRDPDNAGVQVKLKALRRVVAELTRVRAVIDTAMNSRKFDAALLACNEGLIIDKDSKKLMSEMHSRKSKAYSMIAQQHQRSIHTHSAAVDAPPVDEDPIAAAQLAWKKALQEANSSIYYDATAACIPTLFLKCMSLQALERWDEACSELDACAKGIGEDDPSVMAKLKEAKQLLKKSKRVDLYKILGVPNGELASEAEIKKAYKKAALKWHPDRHSSKGEENKKVAEAKFKEIGDAFDLLSDAQRKSLYDQGFDREEIEQKMEEAKQRAEYGGGRGHHGHGHGGGGYHGFGF